VNNSTGGGNHDWDGGNVTSGSSDWDKKPEEEKKDGDTNSAPSRPSEGGGWNSDNPYIDKPAPTSTPSKDDWNSSGNTSVQTGTNTRSNWESLPSIRADTNNNWGSSENQTVAGSKEWDSCKETENKGGKFGGDGACDNKNAKKEGTRGSGGIDIWDQSSRGQNSGVNSAANWSSSANNGGNNDGNMWGNNTPNDGSNTQNCGSSTSTNTLPASRSQGRDILHSCMSRNRKTSPSHGGNQSNDQNTSLHQSGQSWNHDSLYHEPSPSRCVNGNNVNRWQGSGPNTAPPQTCGHFHDQQGTWQPIPAMVTNIRINYTC
jgi:hypothetical protein